MKLSIEDSLQNESMIFILDRLIAESRIRGREITYLELSKADYDRLVVEIIQACSKIQIIQELDKPLEERWKSVHYRGVKIKQSN